MTRRAKRNDQPACRHLDRAAWKDVRGTVTVDFSTGDAVFQPGARGNMIRTHCDACGGFLGYRPVDSDRPKPAKKVQGP